MTLEDLRILHQAMPPGSSISLSREAVGGLLDALGSPEPSGPVPRDLSLKDVADRVGRAESTVKGWCHCGKLPGAYKLNGRDWRVPAAALETYLARMGAGRTGSIRPHSNDLSSWRRGAARQGNQERLGER